MEEKEERQQVLVQVEEPMVQARRSSLPRMKEARVALRLKVQARIQGQEAQQEQGTADPWKVREGGLREAHPLRFLRLRKVGQLGVSHLKSEQQEQIIRAEEGRVIPEIVERVAGPRKEQEEELREAHPLRFLRLRKVGQLGVSHLKSEQQEQIIQAEEGKVILEIVERVAVPKKEREELREVQYLNSLQELGSQSERVHPKDFDQFFLRAD
jgi:hypothetical protein